jgi:hypothetical protein
MMPDALMGQTEIQKMSDPVNHPSHYKTTSGLESIDVIDAFEFGFSLGNCFKYMARAKKKGSELEDLQKARWYLNHEIEAAAKRERLKKFVQVKRSDTLEATIGFPGIKWAIIPKKRRKKRPGYLARKDRRYAFKKAMRPG